MKSLSAGDVKKPGSLLDGIPRKGNVINLSKIKHAFYCEKTLQSRVFSYEAASALLGWDRPLS